MTECLDVRQWRGRGHLYSREMIFSDVEGKLRVWRGHIGPSGEYKCFLSQQAGSDSLGKVSNCSYCCKDDICMEARIPDCTSMLIKLQYTFENLILHIAYPYGSPVQLPYGEYIDSSNSLLCKCWAILSMTTTLT